MADPDQVVVRISKGGDAGCLYNDQTSLRSLGHAEITRVTDIKWFPDKQMWGIVILANGVVLQYVEDREEAIRREIQYLNKRIKDGTMEELIP